MSSFGYKFGIFLLVLLFVEGAIFGIDYLRTPKYQSTAKYMIVIKVDKEDQSLNAYNLSVAANHLAELTAEIIDTASFIKKVYQRSGIIYSAEKIEEYRKQIEAKVIKETEIVEVSITNGIPQRAQKICQATIDTLQEEIKNTDWSQRDFDIELIDPPSLPLRPTSPQPIKDLMIGFIGVLMIWGFYYLIVKD